MRTNNKKNKKNTSSKNTVSKKNQTLLTTALTSSLGLALTPSVGAADTIAINNLTSNTNPKDTQYVGVSALNINTDATFDDILNTYKNTFTTQETYNYKLYYINLNEDIQALHPISDTTKKVTDFLTNDADLRFFVASEAPTYKLNAEEIIQPDADPTPATPNIVTIEHSFYISSKKTDANGTGAAVLTQKANDQVIVNNSYFYNNVGNSGGAFYLKGTQRGEQAANIIDNSNSRYTNTFTNSIFEQNHANGNNSAVGSGGAIDSSNKVVVDHSDFINNKANQHGGAIQISERGQAQITNSKFVGNESINGHGGALNILGELSSFNNPTATAIDNSLFEGNRATNANDGKGGAINFDGSNRQDGANGETLLNRNSATISSSTFKDNKSTQGTINVTSYEVSIDNSTFEGNETTKGGAFLSLEGDTSNNNLPTIVNVNDNVTVDNNTENASSDILFRNRNSTVNFTSKSGEDQSITLANGIVSDITSQASNNKVSINDKYTVTVGKVLGGTESGNGLNVELNSGSTLKVLADTTSNVDTLSLSEGATLDLQNGQIETINGGALILSDVNDKDIAPNLKIDAIFNKNPDTNQAQGKADTLNFNRIGLKSQNNQGYTELTKDTKLNISVNEKNLLAEGYDFDVGTDSAYTENVIQGSNYANVDVNLLEKGHQKATDKYVYTITQGLKANNEQSKIGLVKSAALYGLAKAVAEGKSEYTLDSTIDAGGLDKWGAIKISDDPITGYEIKDGTLQNDFTLTQDGLLQLVGNENEGFVVNNGIEFTMSNVSVTGH